MSFFKSEWRVELPATLEAVDNFCAEFRLWRAATCADLDGFSTELLLREALTNSVEHGGTDDPNEPISCVLRAKRGRLLIAIQDRGKGFDWRAAWDSQADPCDTGGRGIEILRRYASAVRFNPRGNSVMLIKRFEGKPNERRNKS
jgi:anti-sigma regulatory factor (Ser/Thr protein kinase)